MQRGSTILTGLAVGLTLAALAPVTALAQPREVLPGDAALVARYRLPASRFIEIDGEQIHYADEGVGPAIVLIHGSFSSLRQWTGWAKALKGRYRVIRFDMSPAGLSGPAPDGDASIAHKVQVIDKLTRRLGVERFILVATSSGGGPGAAYAAEHPDRVTGLVLNNIAAGPVGFDPSAFSPELKAALAEDAQHRGFHRPEYWRQILLLNFSDKRQVTPALVREWTELNNRALRAPPAPPAKPGGGLERTPDDLPRITAPTLLLWSADDHETPVARDGQKALALSGAADKAMAVIPACGHMMPLECADRGLALARPFLDRISRPER